MNKDYQMDNKAQFRLAADATIARYQRFLNQTQCTDGITNEQIIQPIRDMKFGRLGACKYCMVSSSVTGSHKRAKMCRVCPITPFALKETEFANTYGKNMDLPCIRTGNYFKLESDLDKLDIAAKLGYERAHMLRLLRLVKLGLRTRIIFHQQIKASL